MGKQKVKYLQVTFGFRVKGYGDIRATYLPDSNQWHVASSTHAMYRPENRSRQVESKSRAKEIVHEFLTKIDDEQKAK